MNFSVKTWTGLILPGKKDDKNIQQKLLSVTKSLRSEILLRKEVEDHCKKVQNEKLVKFDTQNEIFWLKIADSCQVLIKSSHLHFGSV